MEERLMEAIKGLSKEIDKKAKDIIETLGAKLEKVEIENQELRLITQQQEKRIENLEKIVKKKNLIVYGMEEVETSGEYLEAQVCEVISKNLKIEIQHSDIESARRIGKKKGEKERPVLIEFNTWKKKMEILKQRKYLKGSKLFIEEDFPMSILNKRRELIPKIKQLRGEGKKAYLRGEKIIINGQIQENVNEKEKRARSESTEEQSLALILNQHESSQIAEKINNPKKRMQYRARSGSVGGVPSVRNFFEELPNTKNF